MATVLRIVLEWLAWLMIIAGAFLYELHDKDLKGEWLALGGTSLLLLVTLVSGRITTGRPRRGISRERTPFWFWLVVALILFSLARIGVHLFRRLSGL